METTAKLWGAPLCSQKEAKLLSRESRHVPNEVRFRQFVPAGWEMGLDQPNLPRYRSAHTQGSMPGQGPSPHPMP